MKYRIGDIVRIICINDEEGYIDNPEELSYQMGEIIEVDGFYNKKYPYRVKFNHLEKRN